MLLDDLEVHGVVDEAHELQIGRGLVDLGRERLQHDRQDARAVLAGRFGDELFDPVGQALDVRAVRDQTQLVAARAVCRRARDRGREHEGGVALVVDRDFEQGGLGFIEQLGDVDARQSRRHEAERRQRGVSAADGGVGCEDAVARLTGGGLQRRAGVGHDDDPVGGIDAEIAPRGLERTPRRVGLDGRARLRRDHERGLLEATRFGIAVDRGEHLARRGRIEDHERHARGRGDDLGGERRAAHAGQHDARDAAGVQVGSQRLDLGHERSRDRHGIHPAQSLRGLGCGVRTPEIRVARRHAAGHERVDQTRQGLLDDALDVTADVDLETHRALSGASARAAATVCLRSCQAAMNLATPSSSSTWVTSAMSTPTAASSSNVRCASA